MSKSNKLLSLSMALAACLSAPAAFAQSVNAGAKLQATVPATPATPAVPAVKANVEAGATAQATAATPATPATPAAPAKKSWSELDANGNGSLSPSEAAPMEGLSEVFADADADANGELTQDEYKAWLAANGKAKAHADHGG